MSEFSEVFAEGLGQYFGPPVTLHMKEGVAPVCLKPRRVPLALRSKLDKEIDRLCELGVLEPVTFSEWATPIVLVFKPNGDLRLCGDYKSTINRALNQDLHPVPLVPHLLAELAGGQYFIKLDLSQAYLQLRVDEASAKLQTITTHRGAFKCNRLQFGVSSAPGIFQRFIECLLQGIPGTFPYFDDILIKGATMQELSQRFRAVLKRFSEAGILLKQDKCIIGAEKIEYLGYQVDASGIRPRSEKVEAIHNAPVPKKKEELQAFLGLLNFYHAFLRNKASVAEPLHRLLDKAVPWNWLPIHDEAFRRVKMLLSSDSLLAHFDPRLPITVTCDASPYGIGAVFGHVLPNGMEVPVSFFSRTLSAAERNYAQIDKEALAIVNAVKKFHHYLYGYRFQIRTDHKPLLGLLASTRPTPEMMSQRMLRLSQLLNTYKIDR